MRARGLVGGTVVTGVAVALTACGGGGGGGGGSTAPIAETTIDGDLYLHGEHYHQDYYHHSFKPGYVWIYFDVFNTSSQTLKNVPWQIRDLAVGRVVASGVFTDAAHYTQGTNGKNGTGHDINAFLDYSASPGSHQVQLEIDPGNRVHESNEDNNTYIFTFDVPTDPGQHVPANLHYYAAEAHFHDGDPALGDLDFHFVFENSTGAPVTGVTWNISCAELGIDQTYTFSGTVQPGQTAETSHALHVAPGDHVFTMTLDPAHAFGSNTDGQVRVFHLTDTPTGGG